MAKSYVVYQGGASVYSFPFDYLSKQFINVRTIATDGAVTDLTYGSGYTVVDKSVHLTAAVPATARVRIFRKTDTKPITVFNDASILRAKDLNALDVQLLHLSEEAQDSVEDAGIALDDSDGKYTAKMKVIKNVADGTEAHDAVNRGQLDAIAGSASAAAGSAASALQYRNEAQGFRNEAENFKNQAAASATASANSATASETSKQASEAARNTANQIKADTQGLKDDVIALKADTIVLHDDTKVLHDDTKVMHDEVMTATPSRCLPLAGGTMTGNILIDEQSGGRGLLGKASEVGFRFADDVVSFRDFSFDGTTAQRDIFSYSPSQKYVKFGVTGVFDSGINVNDSTEAKIIGTATNAGIGFVQNQVGMADWKRAQWFIAYQQDTAKLDIGTAGANGGDLVLHTPYHKSFYFNHHSTDPISIGFMNDNGAQGAYQVLNSTHYFRKANGTDAGNVYTENLLLAGNKEWRFLSTSTADALHLWNQTDGEHGALRLRSVEFQKVAGGGEGNAVFCSGIDTGDPVGANTGNINVQSWQSIGFRDASTGQVHAGVNVRTGEIRSTGTLNSHDLIVNGSNINTMLRAAGGQNSVGRTFHSILNKSALTPVTNASNGLTTYNSPNNEIPVTEDWTSYDTIVFAMSDGNRNNVGYRMVTGSELNYALNHHQKFFIQTVGNGEWLRINAAVQIGSNTNYVKSGPTVFHCDQISGYIVDILVSRVTVV